MRALARHHGVNQKTIAEWKKRRSTADLPTGPKDPRSTSLYTEEEAVVVAFRRHTLLPVDDWCHTFEAACADLDVQHRLTKPRHPWTNGQVERMNRTIKDATIKLYHYDSHDQLRQHLRDFVAAYDFGRRLKTFKGLTPYEAICTAWQKEPTRFTSDPHHQLPGPNM